MSRLGAGTYFKLIVLMIHHGPVLRALNRTLSRGG